MDEETVDSIHDAYGGWPAGVRMAILAARQIDRVGNVPAQLRRDWALADYLATEVLASLPDELRDFVLDSCLDEQVCPSLLDSIRGTTTAETLLEQCLSDGIFLSRGTAATDEPWFSWHPLFASHVQRCLSSDRPARAAELHAAAAAWWVSVDVPTAIEHAAAASDELAARIFSEHWLQLFLEGRVDAVMGAIEHLPHALTAHGDAHLAKALVLVGRGRLDAARAEVAAARQAAAALRDEAKVRLDERTVIVELLLTGYDEGLGVAVETGEAVLEQMARAERVPDPTITASLQCVVGMGEARLQSHHAACAPDAAGLGCDRARQRSGRPRTDRPGGVVHSRGSPKAASPRSTTSPSTCWSGPPNVAGSASRPWPRPSPTSAGSTTGGAT